VSVLKTLLTEVAHRIWLIAKERHYGGWTLVTARYISPHLRPDQIKSGLMRGGDRMRHHGYAKHYAKYIRRFIGKPIVCVEVGILKGTGLAIWSDLFPHGQVIGLDIDPSHFKENEPTLRRLGAFPTNNVSVYSFDQFDCDPQTFSQILRGKQIDLIIDDAFHSDQAIANTIKAATPHLASDFVYVIEDNDTLPAEEIRRLFLRPIDIERHGLLTIVTPA
jgi:hypothetical protein